MRTAALAITCCLTLPACRGDSPNEEAGPSADFDLSALNAPPDAQWLTAPADYVVGGVEFMDPHGALEGMDLTVRSRPVDGLLGGLAGWTIEPSGELDDIIYARFPLPAARPPGQTLTLWTQADDGWWTQSVGIVTDDGQSAVVGMIHFSDQALVSRDAAREGFVAGTYCNGEEATGHVFGANEKNRTDLTESQINMPIGPAADRPTHASMADRLTNISQTSAAEWVVFKNEERAGPSEACCWAGNPCSYSGQAGYEDEDYFGDPAIEEPLRRLGERVRTLSCGALKLGVSEIFDTGTIARPSGEHSPNSLHYEGRAVDLFLLTTEPAGWSTECGDDDLRRGRYALGLSRLAQLAAESRDDPTVGSGFGFVKFEVSSKNRANNHVHASVSAGGSIDPLAPNTFEAAVEIGGSSFDMSSTDMIRGERPDGALTLTATDFADDGWTRVVLVLPNPDANGVFDLGGMDAPTLEVVRDGETSYAANGTLVFAQVLPFEDKNYLTTTDGTFTATLEEGGGSVSGRFTVDDLVFWDL